MRALRPELFLLAVAAACAGSDGAVTTFNTPPVAGIKFPTDGSQVPEQTLVTFEGTVSDDQTPAHELVVIWSSDIDGVLQDAIPADASGATTVATANLSVGNHAITLTTADEHAESASFTITLVVTDVPDPPTISIVHPQGSEGCLEGNTFEFVARVGDAQDAPEDLSVSFETDQADGVFCRPPVDELGVAKCSHALTGGAHNLLYTVTDLDGYATQVSWPAFPVTPLSEQDNDGDRYTESMGDCDDANNLVYPGAPEIEDGADNDCDDIIDEGTDAYDDDGDGYSENDGDCDDTTIDIAPGAIEVCNGIDDDCTGDADPEDSIDCLDYYYDADGDGFGSDKVDPKCLCAPDGSYSAPTNLDCYDYDAEAAPGHADYETTARPDGSFDWNCDGVETQYYTSRGSCSGWISCALTGGWDGSTPACGATSDYVTGCDTYWWGECYETTDPVTQACL